MRWQDMRRSQNVEDRTGTGSRGGMPLGGGMKLGGGAIILVVIASLVLGVNPLSLLGMLEGGPAPATTPVPQSAPAPGGAPPTAAPGDPQRPFLEAVLGDTEDVWTALFKAMGTQYSPPGLVLFRGAVVSACGRTSSAAGPFYCPADRKLYVDTNFFRELHTKFGAPGDFAQAYVIAHEVGHHVQNLNGTMQKFDEATSRGPEGQRNAMAIRLELQADCYAGVWGYFAAKRNRLDPGDAEEGLRAAAAVGDDMIQKRTQGYVVPDAFTHGTAQQRMRWFQVGMKSGDPRVCNTFAAKDL